jgi:hypothetical protein
VGVELIHQFLKGRFDAERIKGNFGLKSGKCLLQHIAKTTPSEVIQLGYPWNYVSFLLKDIKKKLKFDEGHNGLLTRSCGNNLFYGC